MDGKNQRLPLVGRAAMLSPPNRFERIYVEAQFEHFEHDSDFIDAQSRPPTEYLVDDSQSILSENDSPDVPFRFSLNAYRGCAHGCAYCYARPTHEYLGMSAGLDFETKIFVKQRAPELLAEALSHPKWKPEPIMMSGITDCYQPAERHFQLTRQCLEVAWKFQQPISIITKNALITRDLDILSKMAEHRLVQVAISITSLDQSLTRAMEPRTSCPEARLRAIGELRQAGVPTAVMLAPLVPGLTDSEIPAMLEAAANRGAQGANYILVRLPLSVQPIFLDWLEHHFPNKRQGVEACIRSIRDGKLNDANFRSRMRGTGVLADQIRQMFRIYSQRLGLNGEFPKLDCSRFQPPKATSGQMLLF